MADGERPSELRISDRWDKCIELSLQRVFYGTIAGGLAGLILFRGGGSRIGTLAFGSGCGVGSAYADCRREFE